MTHVPARTVFGLIACYLIGAASSVIASWFYLVHLITSPTLPRSSAIVSAFAAIHLCGYGMGAALGWLMMSGAQARAAKLYELGVVAVCVTAPVAGGVAAAAGPDALVYSAAPPVVVSVLLVAGWNYRRQLETIADKVTHGLQARAGTGHPTLAWASLGVFGGGYVTWIGAPSPETLFFATVLSVLSAYLAARALPNVVAVIAFVSSALFFAAVFLRPLGVFP